MFSRAVRQLHAFARSFDRLNRLCVSFVIGQDNRFWFWFCDTQLKSPLIGKAISLGLVLALLQSEIG